MAKTNPNKANQYVLDPRQKLCWDFYVNPKSETFSNGLQSALKAGYDEEYSEQITVQAWFLEKLRTLNMLDKAEKNLNDFLEMPTVTVTKDGVVVENDTKLRVKADVTKFVAERVGKALYSTRQEVNHTNNGGSFDTLSEEDRAKLDKVLGKQ
jgi:hypothetical protein